MFEGLLHGPFGDFIEHHAISGYSGFLGNDFFSQMLTDRFAFSVGVGGQIDCLGGFRRLLQIGHDLTVVSLFRIGNDFVFRLKVVLDIDAQPLRRQIFDMPDRSLHDEVFAEIFIDSFRLGRRFDNYEILCHYDSAPVTH